MPAFALQMLYNLYVIPAGIVKHSKLHSAHFGGLHAKFYSQLNQTLILFLNIGYIELSIRDTRT